MTPFVIVIPILLFNPYPHTFKLAYKYERLLTPHRAYILHVHPCGIVILWASRNDIHRYVLLTMMSAIN